MLGFLLSLVIAIPILFAVLMLTSFGVLRDTNDSAASSITTVVSEATQSLDTVLTTSEPATVAADPEPAAAIAAGDAASADAAPQLGQVYVVIAGDVLHQIAVRFAVTTDALVAYNALSNPNALRIGQELRIPPPGYQPPDPEDAESTDFATGPLSPRG
ncbi:MAG: LysM repeat-containing protein [Chloroflexi bacterium]|nr:MAG: LysM repeat-containing protein [Chloroflexota bacterium]